MPLRYCHTVPKQRPTGTAQLSFSLWSYQHPLKSQANPRLLTFARGGFGGLQPVSKPRRPQFHEFCRQVQKGFSDPCSPPRIGSPCFRGGERVLPGASSSERPNAVQPRHAPPLPAQPAPTDLGPGMPDPKDTESLRSRKFSYLEGMNCFLFLGAVLNSPQSSTAPQWSLCGTSSSFWPCNAASSDFAYFRSCFV